MTGSGLDLAGHTRFAAVDFESTGAAAGRVEEPLQIGLAVMQGTEILPQESYVSLLRTNGPATPAARRVHGIEDGQRGDSPTLPEIWTEVRHRLGGAVVVAHGAATERRFLRALPLHGFGPWLDTLPLARALLPDLPDHSLSRVLGELRLADAVRSLCPERDWHDALFDAVACLVFLREVLRGAGLEHEPVGRLLQPLTGAYHRGRGWRRLRGSLGL